MCLFGSTLTGTGVRITVVRLSVLIEPAAGNAYDEDTKLHALERYGTRFRIGMTTLVVFGVLAAGFVGSPAVAAVEDRAPTELWEQFPLDGARDTATSREQSSDAVRAVSEPARVSSPASVQAAQSDEADETLRFAALATGIGLLIVGISAAFTRARRARRRRDGASEQGGSQSRRVRAPDDPPPTASREAEQLVRLLNGEAAARGRQEDADAHVQNTTGAGVELDDLEAPPGVQTPKTATTSAQFDAEVLKRKPAADAQILEAKAKHEAVA